MKGVYFKKYAKFVLLILALVFLALAGIKFLRGFSFPDVNWSLSRKNKIKIESGTFVSQVFTASRNNLTKVRILFGKSNLKDGGEIKLAIKDESCNSVLRKTTFQRGEMQPDGYYDFIFPPLKDSGGKTYCLEVYFNSKKINYKSFYVFISNHGSPGGGYLVNSRIGERNENQSLSMRPAYRNDNRWQDIIELDQRISQYKPWFLKHVYLYIIAFLCVFLIFFIVIAVILM
jgi:hypothetical protein